MGKRVQNILEIMQKVVVTPATISNPNPFTVLISTVLSQRTKDRNTEKASKQLFESYATPKKISAAPLAEIKRLIKPAGFYKVKAARIKEISKQIVERFKGKVPNDLQMLLSLPGVGRKTANCVLVYGFNKPAMPVDVHVHRISNRIGLVETKTPRQTEQWLIKIIPKQNWLSLNRLFVGYGQIVCLPRNPKCAECKIRPQCNYFLAVRSRHNLISSPNKLTTPA